MENLTCCSECNGVFIRQRSEKLCTQCFNENQNILKQTKLYISNPTNLAATMEDITEATGSSEKQIIEWIEEGELNISHLTNFLYECEVCKKNTYEGRLCSTCMERITEVVKPSTEKSLQV